jgi:hypothetical protein
VAVSDEVHSESWISAMYLVVVVVVVADLAAEAAAEDDDEDSAAVEDDVWVNSPLLADSVD